ncbi:transglutaminase family protein [Frankia sp. CNm7]|uniref:Transglutaminase family protein n=1 Tax=Frankia nepalensis TaxID=1836974 RepID=A0A937RFX9_9ACTN|nr:transglutaminase-like domain-containing protein [Frankia nepalensis]MBL7501397.1 transglutaminase family protein [Frankia nepalensis]MBL7511924.1 transglutaminase family protein [Frankia nepalensis]MBL7523435.1 transglutaminase family protein [Frankia nepalensis]MBL7628255.1 transglutaminase family protein [Frankia nepalensis]
MSVRSRARFADVVRRTPIDLALACQLIAAEADPDAETADVAGALDRLADEARPLLAARLAATRSDRASTGQAGGEASTGQAGGEAAGRAGGGAAERAEGEGAERAPVPDPLDAAATLHESLGLRAGFAGLEGDYDDLRSSLLPAVLRRRHGLPIILSVIWLEVAARLDVPAYPVGLPGHMVVAIGTPRENVLVDPFVGGRRITVHDAAARVRAAGVPFSRTQLAPMSSEDLLARVLGNIRVLAARADATVTRLWAVELSLLLPHHPASLRRERGELRIRRGDFLGGARDLVTFADAVEVAEPTAAAAARAAAIAARARLN